MKAYTDIFKKPLDKQEVSTAVKVIIDNNSASPGLLQRTMRIGYGKAASILNMLDDAGVISEWNGTKPRRVILKSYDTALNAALRQLRKGK